MTVQGKNTAILDQVLKAYRVVGKKLQSLTRGGRKSHGGQNRSHDGYLVFQIQVLNELQRTLFVCRNKRTQKGNITKLEYDSTIGINRK